MTQLINKLVIIAHDIRSTHNVGSLFRTAECLGVDKIYLTGYTPYPIKTNDQRLPHLARKIDAQINKTALDTAKYLEWSQNDDIKQVLNLLKKQGYTIVALEQSEKSIPITDFKPTDKVAILLGRELEGIDQDLLEMCHQIVEIPMLGKKESLNVIQAAAIAIYQAQFYPNS